MSAPESVVTFNYIMSVIPQLVTIVAAIAAGFRFLQSSNEKKIRQTRDEIMQKFDTERDFISKDIKSIYSGINNLDNQYKIIVEFIKQELTRHDRLFDKLGGSKT